MRMQDPVLEGMCARVDTERCGAFALRTAGPAGMWKGAAPTYACAVCLERWGQNLGESREIFVKLCQEATPGLAFGEKGERQGRLSAAVVEPAAGRIWCWVRPLSPRNFFGRRLHPRGSQLLPFGQAKHASDLS